MSQFEENHFGQMKGCQCNCRRKEENQCPCRRRDEGQRHCSCKNAGCNKVAPCHEKSCNQCKSCCSSCYVCCQAQCEQIRVNIRVFNESTLVYTVTQGDNPVDQAVSFSVFGLDFPTIIPKPRTITGVIRADGTIYSGEGFRVSHRKGTGYYTITFNQPFGAVDSAGKPPVIQIIEEPMNGTIFFQERSFGEKVADTISGLIDREGNIQFGTKLQNSNEYAFTVRKDPCYPGLFIVEFKPELNVTFVFTDPYSGSNIRVFEVEASQSGCCHCHPGFGHTNEPVTGTGVDIVSHDSSGFSYRTYEETTLRRRYTDLPVVFNILVTREK